MTPAPSKPAIKGTVLVHLDFVLAGVVMTILGPMLPDLIARWHLTDAQAGRLFTAQFISSIVGMLISGATMQWLGNRRTLGAGLLLMALGMALLAQAGWALGIASVCIIGIGFGSNTPTANLLIAESNPTKRASALNLLNASWGIGAMICPLLVASVQRSHQLPLLLYVTSGALVSLAVGLAAVRFISDAPKQATKGPTPPIVRPWLVPWVAALFFTYVGTENCVGGWVASYAHRMDTSAQAFWAMTPSFFWGALLVGRALAPVLLARLRETSVAILGLSLSTLGVVSLLAAQRMELVVIGASLAGLGLASIFPISVSMLSRWFDASAVRVSGIIFAMGNLGGALLPAVVGMISTHFGGLRIGFLVPLLGSLIMLTVYVANGRAQSRAAVAA